LTTAPNDIAQAVAHGRPWVIDTNCVLDLRLFNDPRTTRLRDALEAGHLRWLATPAMAAELERVLTYPAVQRAWQRLGALQPGGKPDAPASVMRWFYAHTQLCDSAPFSGLRCQDRDDQGFIDLAVAHGAILLSKDRLVLRLGRRMQALGAWATTPDGLDGLTDCLPRTT
jgi:predicted nucleic acid-binding protein